MGILMQPNCDKPRPHYASLKFNITKQSNGIIIACWDCKKAWPRVRLKHSEICGYIVVNSGLNIPNYFRDLFDIEHDQLWIQTWDTC